MFKNILVAVDLEHDTDIDDLLRIASDIGIVLPEHFTLVSFLQVSLTCALGIFAIATAVSGYFLVPLNGVWRALMAVAGLLMVAPSWGSDIAALIVA